MLPSTVLPESRAKAMGAFYTDVQVADFLVRWAIRSARDTAVDPSFGGGVFLRAACERVLQLGGAPAAQVFGIEIDEAVHSRIADKLYDEFGLPRDNLRLCDFFDVSRGTVEPVDAVVGNPPFIRYQRFAGAVRKTALARAARQGVRLSGLCSSWAPFLVHSMEVLKPGGRLAMVLPMEIGHASYARPVVRFLCDSFGKVTLLTFRKKLFPDLSEDTLLLLADERGGRCTEFSGYDLPHVGLLRSTESDTVLPEDSLYKFDARALADGKVRLAECFLPTKTRELYAELRDSSLTRRLGDLVDVGIGYVTGANKFFHLSPSEVAARGISPTFLQPAIHRGRAMPGLRFDYDDWENAVARGDASYLLRIETARSLPDEVRRYIDMGEATGVSATYKCRMRKPWFRVPHVYHPDAFLTYMSGSIPRMIVNESLAVAPNTLHVVRRRPTTQQSMPSIAVLFHSSLSHLSAEIEGHSLGGGMLKIEPTEAENILVPTPAASHDVTAMAREVDSLTRQDRVAEAQEWVDQEVLRDHIGLTKADCRLLQEATTTLRNRRHHRSASNESC